MEPIIISLEIISPDLSQHVVREKRLKKIMVKKLKLIDSVKKNLGLTEQGIKIEHSLKIES